MDTRKKVDEAKYFLNKLKKAQKGRQEHFYFNLSAFLNAWRSVLDAMLWDFVKHYGLGFDQEDRVNDMDFKAVATALKNTEALSFIKWWRKKQGKLILLPCFK